MTFTIGSITGSSFSGFISAREDYLLFFCGLAFISLATMLFTLDRCSRSSFPWKFFTLFSLLHGINEWLDMLAGFFGDSAAFPVIGYAVMTASGLFLAEFGRRGSAAAGHDGKGTGRWTILMLLLLSLAGTAYWRHEAYNFARSFLGLFGGLFAAWALYRYYRARFPGEKNLLFPVWCMASYALTAGIELPGVNTLAVSVFNADILSPLYGLPLRMVRGFLALIVTAAVWRHITALRQGRRELHETRVRLVGFPLALFCLVLISGWAILERPDGLKSACAWLLPLLHRNISAFLAMDIARVRLNVILVAMLMSLLTALFYITLWRRMETRKAIARVTGEQSLLLDTVDIQVWYLEDEQTYGVVNKSHAAFLGRTKEELERKTLWEVLSVEDARSVIDGNHAPFAMKRQIQTEEWLTDAQGRKHLMSVTRTPRIDSSGNVEYVVCSAADMTERKQAEEEKARLESQLARSAKMEALGTLAGGIAHDFNNLLTAIMGYVELGILNASKPEKVMKNLQDALRSSKRAKDLIDQILAFSRHAEKKFQPVELQLTVRESLGMLRSMIPPSVEIRQHLSPCTVMGDTAQFHQMLMNLAINAAQAIGENHGVVEVSLEEVTLDEESGSGLNLPPGPYVRLTVHDTGQGMPPEILERIYEPYFTTKKGGTGSGMGLSIVHGIVKRHGGAITCRSEPGEGATFQILLPEIPAREKSPSNRPCDDLVLPTGSERILIVDDEPALVDVEKEMLENLGYQATAVSSSTNALEVFRKNPYQYDLVITDMIMPDMTGYRLSQKIMEVRQDIPIILCTGYSEHITEEKAKNAGIRDFIMKPFKMNVLAKSIRKTLDETRQEGFGKMEGMV
jgi:PAS domain S-box-containing protein